MLFLVPLFGWLAGFVGHHADVGSPASGTGTIDEFHHVGSSNVNTAWNMYRVLQVTVCSIDGRFASPCRENSGCAASERNRNKESGTYQVLPYLIYIQASHQVRLVAVSIDDRIDTIERSVEKRGRDHRLD